MRDAVHGKIEGESGQTLDLFRGVPRPLRNKLDHGRRKVRISIHRHLPEGPSASDYHKRGNHEDQEALAQREMYDAMYHRSMPCLLYRCNEFINCKKRLPLPAT